MLVYGTAFLGSAADFKSGVVKAFPHPYYCLQSKMLSREFATLPTSRQTTTLPPSPGPHVGQGKKLPPHTHTYCFGANCPSSRKILGEKIRRFSKRGSQKELKAEVRLRKEVGEGGKGSRSRLQAVAGA